MADALERITNLVALLMEARSPLTQDQIIHELDGQYPAGDSAQRGAFERDKALLREIGVPLERRSELLKSVGALSKTVSETEVLPSDQQKVLAERFQSDVFTLGGDSFVIADARPTPANESATKTTNFFIRISFEITSP